MAGGDVGGRMKARVTREWQLRILFVLNQLVPPILRDSRWFGTLLLRGAFGRHAATFLSFKEAAPSMTHEEFARAYADTAECLPTTTDLNRACFDRIVAAVDGPTVLEVGAGLGLLAGGLSARHDVTACDIVVEPSVAARERGVRFVVADAERLPFGDGSFDTVVCTHTLEHVRNLGAAISELRRVVRRQLIVVVPAERPYRYTFNLHLHFFPYPHTLRLAMGASPDAVCEVVGGDLLYEERLDG